MNTENKPLDDEKKIIPEWNVAADDQIIWIGVAIVAILASLFGWMSFRGGDDEASAETESAVTAEDTEGTDTTTESTDPETPTKNSTSGAETPTEQDSEDTSLPTLAQGISVEEDGQTVLLTGYVANEAERDSAEKTITDAGSYTVQNDLKVLEPNVLTVLESAEVANPEVTGKETEITVTGSVATDEEKQEVVEAAKRVPGVTTIIDQIQVNAIDVINSLPQVQFRTGSSQLLSESFADLDRAAELLQNVPDKQIEITGYTDTQGDDAANLRLSENRADAVRQYLIGKDVNAATLTAVGKGETTQFGQGTSDEALAANRKVLFIEK